MFGFLGQNVELPGRSSETIILLESEIRNFISHDISRVTFKISMDFSPQDYDISNYARGKMVRNDFKFEINYTYALLYFQKTLRSTKSKI